MKLRCGRGSRLIRTRVGYLCLLCLCRVHCLASQWANLAQKADLPLTAMVVFGKKKTKKLTFFLLAFGIVVGKGLYRLPVKTLLFVKITEDEFGGGQ